ncbi:MAG: hypothetical protein QF515_15175 [Pseudomonadales bacterium]|nr:hypothetical protein [Pseudomonadales bacterium]
MPVLLIGSDEDLYFPETLTKETTSPISDCTLRLYEGKSHLEAAMDESIAGDILTFVRPASI